MSIIERVSSGEVSAKRGSTVDSFSQMLVFVTENVAYGVTGVSDGF